METNFTLLRELDKNLNPKDRGILHNDEIWQIKNGLCLGERTDIIDLRNLRDFVVLYYVNKQDRCEDRDEILKIGDKMSGIVAVIDDRIWNLGGEV